MGVSTRDVIKADMAANAWDGRSRVAMAMFRACQAPEIPGRLRKAIVIPIYTLVVQWIFGIELPPSTRVGPGLRLNHATGLVINKHAVIGAHCDFKHGCTIGLRRSGGGSPVLGDRVVLGAGAHVVGDITLGDGAEVGAGAVVLTDVPAGAVAVGNPARVISR